MRRIIFISFLVTLLLFISACTNEENKEVPPPGEESQEESGYTGRPPMLGVHTNNGVAAIIRDKSCWEKPDEKCNVVHVEDIETLLSGTSTLSVTPAEEIRFSQVEHNGKSFNAPEEPGRYYYSAIVKYTGDIKGEASFAFALIVK